MGQDEVGTGRLSERLTAIRFRKTNSLFLRTASGRLLGFDASWPCSLPEYQRLMKSCGLRFQDLAWVMVSHMHLDHAGLLGELVARGRVCLVWDKQGEKIDALEAIILRNREYASYVPLDKARLVTGSLEDLQEVLNTHGVGARVLATPGHSDDSLSLVTDEGEALVGDLPPENQIMPDDEVSRASWRLIRASGARVAYPSHAPALTL